LLLQALCTECISGENGANVGSLEILTKKILRGAKTFGGKSLSAVALVQMLETWRFQQKYT
jgi:hypothetical protein